LNEIDDMSKLNSSSQVKQAEYSKGVDEPKEELTRNIPERELKVLIDILVEEADFLLDDQVSL
jgi:hypothetical protein